MLSRNFFVKNGRNLRFSIISARNLFTEESLGVKSLEKWAEERRKVCGIRGAEEFLPRLNRQLTAIEEYGGENSGEKFTILSDDVKNAIAMALASNDKKKTVDLSNILELCQKYHAQTKSWRISSFPFGPTLMKLCYKFKQPDLALKLLLNSQEMSTDFFDNLSSYQLCMDLLFKFKRYDDVVKTWEHFRTKSRVTETVPYPRSLLILLYASLHELNTKESIDYAINLYKSIRNANFPTPRRALMFFVALCQKQGQPEIAYELLTTINADEFVLGRSLKIQLLCKFRRSPEILFLLRKVIYSDLSTENFEDNEISVDVLPDLENLFQKQTTTSNENDTFDENYRQKFEEILKLLRHGRHLVNVSIDRLLKAPIAISPTSTEALNQLLQHAEKSDFDALPLQKIGGGESPTTLLPPVGGFDALSPPQKIDQSSNNARLSQDFDALSVENRKALSSSINALSVSDLADVKKSIAKFSYSNETTDLEDVKTFTRAEERVKRRERMAKALAQKIAADGPFKI